VANEPGRAESTDYACASGTQAFGRGRSERFAREDDEHWKPPGTKELPLLVKGDVAGLGRSHRCRVDKMGTDEVRARISMPASAAINESDVGLDRNVGAWSRLKCAPLRRPRGGRARRGRDSPYYAVIYGHGRAVKQACRACFPPPGASLHRQTRDFGVFFTISKVGQGAGGRVTEGQVEVAPMCA